MSQSGHSFKAVSADSQDFFLAQTTLAAKHEMVLIGNDFALALVLLLDPNLERVQKPVGPEDLGIFHSIGYNTQKHLSVIELRSFSGRGQPRVF